MDNQYIWIPRWDEFQTYQKKGNNEAWSPPWIKDHCRQLVDDAYLDLTLSERGLLANLRLEFSKSRCRLRLDPVRLSRRLHGRVRLRQLERLVDAGFIEFCSGTVLEERRNAFLNRSNPEEEVEVEQKKKKIKPLAKPAAPRARDAVWDTMTDLFGEVGATRNARGKRNSACGDLRALKATPDTIRAAYRSYQTKFPDTTCTDTALATHYPQLVHKRKDETSGPSGPRLQYWER